ncbi:hypothetical protein IQ07DRAFT_588357 [Pyrenochaeta sp. DS3sAY3a]|nr:hypothetical protein IQ07DRAFT_588357 [Pyrenochaeta sp. DS3sAY3a]
MRYTIYRRALSGLHRRCDKNSALWVGWAFGLRIVYICCATLCSALHSQGVLGRETI